MTSPPSPFYIRLYYITYVSRGCIIILRGGGGPNHSLSENTELFLTGIRLYILVLLIKRNYIIQGGGVAAEGGALNSLRNFRLQKKKFSGSNTDGATGGSFDVSPQPLNSSQGSSMSDSEVCNMYVFELFFNRVKWDSDLKVLFLFLFLSIFCWIYYKHDFFSLTFISS